MALADLLRQASPEYDENGIPISNSPAPYLAAPTAPDGQPDGSADVAPITVSPTRKSAPAAAPASPQTPPEAYDNSTALNALRGVNASHDSADNATGSGLGLANILHTKGTLRSILGTLGDAFLISGGKEPLNAQRIYRQQVADASAGFQDNPMLAAGRIAQTGAPDSMKIADQLYTQATNQQLKQVTLQNANTYKDQAADARRDQMIQRYIPLAGGVLNKAKDANDYADRASSILQSARRIDPSIQSISDLGFPEEYDPDFKGGMSAGQVARDDQTTATRDQRGDIAAQSDTTRRRGQDMTASSAGARVAATERGQDISASNHNTPSGTAIYNRDPSHPPIKAITAPKGSRSNPGIPPVNPAVVAKLKANPTPAQQQAFDQYVGHPGAAKAYLGK